MQNKASLIIIFIVVSIVLLSMFSVDKWSSDNSKKGYFTTGTGSSGAELYTGAVSEIKGRNSYGDFIVSEGINVPGAVVLAQTDVENSTQKQVAKSGFENTKAYHHTKSVDFGGASNDWLAQQTNPASDFKVILKASTTDVKTNAAEPTKSKTERKTADSKKKNGRMNDPGEPGITSSLPIDDGTWILLIMLGIYVVKKIGF